MTKKSTVTTPSNPVFAATYNGCVTIGNIMGLHADTVRKRVREGKIPAVRGSREQWVFDHNALVNACIQPFKTHGLILLLTGPVSTEPVKPLPYQPPAKKRNVTDVFFVLDRSGSMRGFENAVLKNLQQQVDALKLASTPDNVFNMAVINFDDRVDTTLSLRSVLSVNSINSLYSRPRGGTAMNDAISTAISQCYHVNQNNTIHAFLISVITDGGENASALKSHMLHSTVSSLRASDKYTFTVAGPSGIKSYAALIGIPEGNVTTWDQTQAGIADLGVRSTTALGRYTASRGTGQTTTNSFYAAPVTANADKFAGQIADKLDDVTKLVKVERVTDSDPVAISKFCEKKFGSFPKGHIYYQLNESEKVQDYKRVVIQDTATGNFYAGLKSAMKLLGVPNFHGTVKIKPGTLGEFKVYIQSTSHNRKLTAGTAVVYLP